MNDTPRSVPRSAHSPRFSVDSQTLRFTSDVTGTMQRWEVDLEAGWPRQITFGADGVSRLASWSPLPGAARGIKVDDPTGTGRTRLLLAHFDEDAETLLTAGYPQAAHTFCGWDESASGIYFSANRRRRDCFDLYHQPLDGQSARMIWRNDAPGYLSHVACSPDDQRLLVRRIVSNVEHALVEIEAATGSARTLTDGAAPATYSLPAYAPDGRSCYVATSRDADFAYLARLDCETGALEPIVAPEADVEQVALSAGGDRLAYLVNEAGYSGLYVRDVATGETRRVPMDALAGVVSALRFAPDEKRLAFTLSQPGNSSDVFLWDLESDTIRQVTHAADAASHVVAPESVAYPSWDGREIPAWLYMPPGGEGEARAAAVWLHGGPEQQARPIYDGNVQALVARGFAVLVPNVRGSTGYGKAYGHLDDGRLRGGAVRDVEHAALWLGQRPDIDGDRIAVCGESYGGFLTLAALARHPELWAAGVSFAGMSSLVTFLERIGPSYRAYREAEYGSLADDRDFLLDISPLTHAARISAPVLLVHGRKDSRVPVGEAEQMATLLRAHGTTAELLTFAGEGHAILDPTNRSHAQDRMTDFLLSHLSPPAATEPPAPPSAVPDLALLAAQASTLDERMRGDVLLSDVTPTDRSQVQVAAWRKAVAGSYPQHFERRLGWEGLDLEDAHRLLGPATWPDGTRLPTWTQTLAAALDAEPSPLLEPNEALPRPPAFGELVQPFVVIARQRVIDRAGAGFHVLGDAAQASLDRGLLRSLSELAYPTLHMKWKLADGGNRSFLGAAPEAPVRSDPDRYRRFTDKMQAGGWAQVLADYPVLGRLLATTTDLWVDAQAEFLSRLSDDWSLIREQFQPDAPLGILADVRPQLSDRHNGGRSVIACTFASGLELIYKPRVVGLEAWYNGTLGWLNERAAPRGDVLQMKALAFLDRDTHGWAEFVRPGPCRDEEEARLFYRRMGQLQALLYAFHGTDCHWENVMACGAYPVVIDAEMLAVPRLREPSPKQPHTRAEEKFQTETAMETGLLPRWQPSPSGEPYDMGALLAGHPAYQTEWTPTPEADTGRDRQIDPNAFRTSRGADPAHLPHLHGAPLDALDYQSDLISGFEAMYDFVIAHRAELLGEGGPVEKLASQHVRVIFRDTSLYARLLRSAPHPRQVKSGMAQSIHLEQMARGYRTADGSKPFNWPMLAAERQAMARLDVPYFVTQADSDALVLPNGERVESCFGEPSVARVRNRITGLGDADRDRQMRIMSSAIALHRQPFVVPSKAGLGAVDYSPNDPPMSRQEAVDEALSIAHRLIDAAIPLGGGQRIWLAPGTVGDTRRKRLAPLGYDLYGGQAGLALFLAATSQATGDAGCRTAAYDVLAPLLGAIAHPDMDLARSLGLGAGSGVGGIVYALTRASGFLNDPDLLGHAHAVARLITQERTSDDAQRDVLAGSAGAILGLLALHDASPSADDVDRAVACGRQLLATRTRAPSGHRVWETVSPGKLLAGMSHGAAGIAYALVRLHPHAPGEGFLEAAHEAIAFEREVFDADAGNWPDFRPDAQPSFWTTWCHGAPGIGLARVGCLAQMDDAALRAEIEVAVRTTLAHASEHIDHLCCGAFGLIDLLIEASQHLERPELMSAARRRAAATVRHSRAQASYRLPQLASGNTYSPSLFRGGAGIGYQLLRLTDPRAFPSVLRWA